MPRSLVALGSNLGDRAARIRAALDAIAQLPSVADLRVSSLHETDPIGGHSGQAPFLNAAASFATELSAERLHAALQVIELAQGRTRAARWDARTLDLDLLLHGEEILNTPSLVLPHSRMAFRHFVLAPAAEVAGEMMHPRIGWTITRLLDHLRTARPYVAIAGQTGLARGALAQRLANEFQARLIISPPGECGGVPSDTAAGPSLRRSLEFLNRQAELLNRDRWPSGDQLAVSDFWLDGLLAATQGMLGEGDYAKFVEHFEQAHAEVALPKLLIVLDTPRSAVGASDSEARSDGEALLAIRLQQLAERPGVGPVLLAPADAESQFEEVSAAIRAMQPASDHP
jgi:2-amino-4-hydroxy-6-hydroxymethyldihydropteridine diphosphokinase